MPLRFDEYWFLPGLQGPSFVRRVDPNTEEVVVDQPAQAMTFHRHLYEAVVLTAAHISRRVPGVIYAVSGEAHRTEVGRQLGEVIRADNPLAKVLSIDFEGPVRTAWTSTEP